MMTTSSSRGIVRSTSFKLCSRAPLMTISLAIGWISFADVKQRAPRGPPVAEFSCFACVFYRFARPLASNLGNFCSGSRILHR